jgi:hypothetical protein
MRQLVSCFSATVIALTAAGCRLATEPNPATAVVGQDGGATPPLSGSDGAAPAVDDGGADVDLAVAPSPGVGTGTHYYVSASGNDHHSGTSPDSAWATMAKVNGMALEPGDVVHVSGKITDDYIKDQSGSATAFVSFRGDGTAIVKGMQLRKAQYVEFADLEAYGRTGVQCGSLVTVSGAGPVQHVTFTRLKLHDSDRGVAIGNHTSGIIGNDLLFRDITVANMQCEGVVFDDYAGDRITFDGGSISHTGIHCPWHTDGSGCHGIYASGGHHHVINGVTFADPNRSWDVSLRRGNTTVSNCRFSGDLMLENCNEDETVYKGYYYIFNNTFLGPGTAIYQGGNNDQGIANPQNTWSIYDNTFGSGQVINFADDSTGYYAYNYDVYMCNNALNGAAVRMGTTAKGVVHDANASHCPTP